MRISQSRGIKELLIIIILNPKSLFHLLAFARTVTFSVDGITARLADSLLAVAALPPRQADLLPADSARVVAESVVPRPAKCRTRCVVIIRRTLDTNPKKSAILCVINNCNNNVLQLRYIKLLIAIVFQQLEERKSNWKCCKIN